MFPGGGQPDLSQLMKQAQEMQLAHWLPTTEVPALAAAIPSWTGLWFACFPTVETLTAQALAIVLVLGSYVTVRLKERPAARRAAEVATAS